VQCIKNQCRIKRLNPHHLIGSLLWSRPAASTLEYLLQKLHQLVGFNIVARLLGRVLNYARLPSEMYLFLQWYHSADTPTLVKLSPFSSLTRLARAVTASISDSTGSSTQDASDKGWKAWFVIFAIKPLFIPTLERCFQWKSVEIAVQASLDANTVDDLPLGGARLVFQEVMFEERKIQKDGEIRLAQMDKDDNLKDRVWIQIN
jgi:hypothetical protein